MKITHLLSAGVLLCLSSQASATGLFFEGGIHVGGETMVGVTFTSGDTEKIKAGELLSLAVGVHTELSDTLQGRFSIGYKFDSINAENGDLDFSRVPLEFLVMQRYTYWMLGGGITYHLSPELTADAPSVGLSGTAKFDDSLGFVFAFDYNSNGNFTRDWYVGGRVTLIDYDNQFGSVRGNSLGAVIGFLF
jgi:hypothetical protein